jgi:hypothetical protein
MGVGGFYYIASFLEVCLEDSPLLLGNSFVTISCCKWQSSSVAVWVEERTLLTIKLLYHAGPSPCLDHPSFLRRPIAWLWQRTVLVVYTPPFISEPTTICAFSLWVACSLIYPLLLPFFSDVSSLAVFFLSVTALLFSYFFCVLLGSVPSTFVAALMSSSLIHVGYSVYIFLILIVSVFCNDK